jgi:hypothetical protein
MNKGQYLAEGEFESRVINPKFSSNSTVSSMKRKTPKNPPRLLYLELPFDLCAFGFIS